MSSRATPALRTSTARRHPASRDGFRTRTRRRPASGEIRELSRNKIQASRGKVPWGVVRANVSNDGTQRSGSPRDRAASRDRPKSWGQGQDLVRRQGLEPWVTEGFEGV